MKWSKTRSFGQHFLINKRILEKIVRSSQINEKEVVCEAGTGNGILTRELCKYAQLVISFELDKTLYQKVLKLSSSFSNLKLINMDIFNVNDLQFDVFVSNLPYSRSKHAIEWLAVHEFDRAIVMLQKEFVSKLQAKPGEANYRAISVIAQHCFDMKKLFEVGRASFEPRPKIDSQVIKLVPNKDVNITVQIISALNFIFSLRNKRASSVSDSLGAKFNFGSNVRIDELAPIDLIELAKSIKKRST
jgi:16S rRNA (adenine1518-N6/adenine1519-N6)-dimethyltransferase